jgi:uncharacterized protein (UPF0333 family)
VIKALAIVCGVLVIALGVGGWLLKQSYERNGELEMAAKTYAKALADKTGATQSRNQTQQRVRQMAPTEKLKGLE